MSFVKKGSKTYEILHTLALNGGGTDTQISKMMYQIEKNEYGIRPYQINRSHIGANLYELFQKGLVMRKMVISSLSGRKAWKWNISKKGLEALYNAV